MSWLKEKLGRFKKWLIGIVVVGIAIGAPLTFDFGAVTGEMVDLRWKKSYETIAFNTIDGDLGVDDYAVSGDGWYIRNVPSQLGHFDFTNNPKDIIGKKLVSVVCEKCAYYSEFTDTDGRVFRERILDSNKYNSLRNVPEYPQPKKTIPRSALGPLKAYGAVAFDATANDGTGTAGASSISWSHTTTSSADTVLLVFAHMRTSTNTTMGVASATYNGTSLIPVQEAAFFDDTAGCNCDIGTDSMVLVAPSSGSNTIVVDFNGTQISSSGGSVSFIGVDQTLPVNGSSGYRDGASDSATSTIISVITGHANSWIVDAITCSSVSCNPWTNDSSQNDAYDVAGTNMDFTVSYVGPIPLAGATSTNHTANGASLARAYNAISLKPSPSCDPSSETCVDPFDNSWTWVAPSGVTEVTAECWGAGGGGTTAGNTKGGGGGGGGAYAKGTVTVTPLSSYIVSVATSTSPNTDGSDSWFSSITDVFADGGYYGGGVGSAGKGGSSTLSIGSLVVYGGGNAGSGSDTGDTSGGGGGSGGPDGAGENGVSGSTTVGGRGGAGNTTSTLGCAGGSGDTNGLTYPGGGLGLFHSNGGGGGGGGDDGDPGGAGGGPGGGGGGGESSGSSGMSGRCVLTYTASVGGGGETPASRRRSIIIFDE